MNKYPKPNIFIITKNNLIYTLSCNGNILHTGQFFNDREAITFYKGYISDWDRAILKIYSI